MENRMIFITGGCRSGKSRYALDYSNRHFSKKLYLATAEVLDEEMALRVENHRRARGPEWQTVEEPLRVVEKIKEYGNQVEAILFDCMTLWLSNLLLRWDDETKILEEVERLRRVIQETRANLIVVTNEVGMGIVPSDPLGRRFRDLAGMANQKMASLADTVIFMVSGIPMVLKGAV
jgi:adenosylcobinamide kinase / adenosylcobinamide-phosphate guanylyltransferase